jgi:carboxyl-terminal processing protease
MPKRNIVFLLATCLLCLGALAARERSGYGRRFGEVMAAIETRYLRDTDADALFRAAVDATVAELDEHSAYLRGDGRASLEAALDQRFGGVGLDLAMDSTTQRPVVVSPLYASPAWRAGIAPGDTILAVDGDDTHGRPLGDVIERLRGRPGDAVSVRVAAATLATTLDPATQPLELAAARDVVLVREVVRTESVLGDRRRADGTQEWMLEDEPGVALVRITSFGERTAEEFTAACRELDARQSKDLQLCVIDLRHNPGGLVQAAVNVCDALLEDGPIVATRGRGDAGTAVLQERRATLGAFLEGVPIVVLVDGLTSSAAEIVAACLQDAGRATVVGSRTYGKGTVQTILPIAGDTGLLKLTTAEYLRPSREPIHRHPGAANTDDWGVKPNAGYEIEPTAEVTDRLRAWRRHRDAVGPPNAVPTSTSGSRPARDFDPVLARALDVIPGE